MSHLKKEEEKMNHNLFYVSSNLENIINRLQLVSQRLIRIRESQSYSDKSKSSTSLNASVTSNDYLEEDLLLLLDQICVIKNQLDLAEKYLLRISTDKKKRD